MKKEQIRMGTKKYLNFFENALLAMAIHRIILDEQGRVVDSVFIEVNEACAKHMGSKIADILGRNITEAIPSIEDTPLLETLEKVALTGEPARFKQYLAPLMKHFVIDVYRIDENTVVTVLQDITEQKKTDEQRETLELLHRTLFEAANDTIFLMRGDRIIDCNTKTEEMFGYAREEILQKKPYDLSPLLQPDGSNSKLKASQLIKAASSKGAQFFQWQHLKKDGTVFDA